MWLDLRMDSQMNAYLIQDNVYFMKFARYLYEWFKMRRWCDMWENFPHIICFCYLFTLIRFWTVVHVPIEYLPKDLFISKTRSSTISHKKDIICHEAKRCSCFVLGTHFLKSDISFFLFRILDWRIVQILLVD